MLPPDALTVTFMEGSTTSAPSGLVHRKTVPYMVVVQPTCGAYEVLRDDRSGRADTGDVILTPPNRPIVFTHLATSPGATHMSSRWLHLSYRLHGVVDVISLLQMPPVVRGPDASAMGELIGTALDIPKSDNDLTHLARMQAVAFQLFAIIARLSKPRPEATALLRGPERLLDVLRYVEANLDGSLSVAELAAVASLSRSRFLGYFKDLTGSSPMAYVRAQRIERAQGLLIHSDLSVGEVADRLGFANTFHFSRCFRQVSGMSPSEFRQTQPALDRRLLGGE